MKAGLSCTVFASRRTTQATGDTSCDARRDLNPRSESLTGSECKRYYGIHDGIALCTAVKDPLKHPLEATLQAYFTILSIVFHGKKAANSYLSPQPNCFFTFSMTKFLKDSDSITSTGASEFRTIRGTSNENRTPGVRFCCAFSQKKCHLKALKLLIR